MQHYDDFDSCSEDEMADFDELYGHLDLEDDENNQPRAHLGLSIPLQADFRDNYKPVPQIGGELAPLGKVTLEMK